MLHVRGDTKSAQKPLPTNDNAEWVIQTKYTWSVFIIDEKQYKIDKTFTSVEFLYLFYHKPHNLTHWGRGWWAGSSLDRIMACLLFGTKPLSVLMLTYCKWHFRNISQWNLICSSKVFFIKKIEISFTKLTSFCNGPNVLISSVWRVW